jgi:hypothetical protein
MSVMFLYKRQRAAVAPDARPDRDYDFYLRRAERLRVEAYRHAARAAWLATANSVRGVARAVCKFTARLRLVCNTQRMSEIPLERAQIPPPDGQPLRANDNGAAGRQSRSA